MDGAALPLQADRPAALAAVDGAPQPAHRLLAVPGLRERHDIAGVWVALFSRWQRDRCGQGGGEDTPGIISKFCAKILDGSPSVAGLLRPKDFRAAFPDEPPNFVRVVRYKYTFTSLRERLWSRGGAVGPWHREVLELGPALGRPELNALSPKIARAYEAALVSSCRPWERVLLWVRGKIGTGVGAELMWVCVALPLVLRLGWWLRAGGMGAVLGWLRRRRSPAAVGNNANA